MKLNSLSTKRGSPHGLFYVIQLIAPLFCLLASLLSVIWWKNKQIIDELEEKKGNFVKKSGIDSLNELEEFIKMKTKIFLVLFLILSMTIGAASAANCTDAGSDGVADNIITVCTNGSCNCECDGTDDQVEINWAIDNVSSLSWGIVNLIGSQYNTEALSVRTCDAEKPDCHIECKDEYAHIVIETDNIVLRGLGKTKTTISATHHDDSIIILVNGTYGNQLQNVTLRDFSIDGNYYQEDDNIVGHYTKSPCGIHALFVNDLTVKNIWMHVGGGGLTGADIDNSTFKNNKIKATTPYQTEGVAGCYESTDGLIEDNELTQASGSGDYEGWALRLEGNHVRWTLRDNYIHDLHTFNPGYSGCKYIYIYNNTIDTVTKWDIYGSKHILIENNTCKNFRQRGINLNTKDGDKPANVVNITIKRNRIINVDNDGLTWSHAGCGIVLSALQVGSGTYYMGDILIEGNTIVDCDRGICFDLDNSGNEYLDNDSSGGVTISNNIIANCSESGIFVESDRILIFINNTYNNIYNCNNNYDGPGISEGTGEIHQNPLLNSTSSSYDLHLKSTVGRYYEGSWVTDAVNSPCVDAGTGPYSNELDYPNGSRNMGAYGNTIYASIGGDVFPPASITDLTNSTYNQTFINWTWTNPPDTDFNYTMVYITGVFEINTSNAYYNDTGLTNGTNYKISTHTVDTSGNVNSTWINATSTTKSPESIIDLIRKPHVVGLGLVTALAACLYTIRRRRRR